MKHAKNMALAENTTQAKILDISQDGILKQKNSIVRSGCSIVNRVDTIFKENYMRTVA